MSDRREHRLGALHHVHLPMMADYGLVVYDRVRQRVEPQPEPPTE